MLLSVLLFGREVGYYVLVKPRSMKGLYLYIFEIYSIPIHPSMTIQTYWWRNYLYPTNTFWKNVNQLNTACQWFVIDHLQVNLYISIWNFFNASSPLVKGIFTGSIATGIYIVNFNGHEYIWIKLWKCTCIEPNVNLCLPLLRRNYTVTFE